MRRGWLGLGRGRADGAELAQELRRAAARGDWAAVLNRAKVVLPELLSPLDIPLLGARALLELAPGEPPNPPAQPSSPAQLEAARQALSWLDASAAVAAEASVSAGLRAEWWFVRGWAQWAAGQAQPAQESWRQSLAIGGSRPAAREALVSAWVAEGRLPDWGVELLEAALADSRS